MYAVLSTSFDISDKDQPAHDAWVDTYGLRDEAKQLMKSNLINMAIGFALTKNTDELERFVDYMSFEIPKKPEPSYYDQASDDASDLIHEYFMAEIVQQLIDNGEVSDDMYNDYEDGDSIFHERIVDQDYSTEESIKLLNDLYKYEEEDSGLWEGLEWDRVLATKAAYTYGNAVSDQWNGLIEQINEIDVEEIKLIIAEEIVVEKEGATVTEEIDLLNYVEGTYGNELVEKLKIELKKQVEKLL